MVLINSVMESTIFSWTLRLLLSCFLRRKRAFTFRSTTFAISGICLSGAFIADLFNSYEELCQNHVARLCIRNQQFFIQKKCGPFLLQCLEIRPAENLMRKNDNMV